VGENLWTLDLLLSTTEFAYDTFVNRTIGISLFEVMHGYRPRQLINLILMTHHHTSVFESAASFASHIHEPHKEVNTQIQKNNANYKGHADLHKKF